MTTLPFIEATEIVRVQCLAPSSDLLACLLGRERELDHDGRHQAVLRQTNTLVAKEVVKARWWPGLLRDA